MVKARNNKARNSIREAILEAEKETSAEIAVVIAPASDEYRSIALSYGLALGSMLALALWHAKAVTSFQLLLCIQLTVAILFALLPALRHLCLRITPARALHHHVAQRAAAEYLHFAHHLPAMVPVVLIYVSVAERFVHIYASRSVQEKIPMKEWNAVIATLTAAIRPKGLAAAMVETVKHAARMLKEPFPPDGRMYKPLVVELTK